MPTKLYYRPEIDGLRAVAILPVVLFHSGLPSPSGGFIGVDVFFVVSGYLITSLILADLRQGKFSLLEFYERRARRILPALFFVLAFCLPLALFLLFPRDLVYFGETLTGVAAFVSNYVLWSQSGYFDPSAEVNPLVHTWTLAVEEQFYVLFPLALMGLWRFGTRTIVGLIALVCLVSLGLAEYGSRYHPAFTFYSLPSRAFELAIGSLTAFWIMRDGRSLFAQVPLLFAHLGSGFGLVLLVFSFWYIDKNTIFPGFATLLPTLGTALIILFTTKATWAYKLLSQKIVVGIGLISYSVYLWHQPLFAFANHASAELPSAATMAILSLASFGFGYLSWRFVERPFRDRTVTSRRLIFAASAIGLVFFGTVGAVIAKNDGFPQRFDDDVLSVWEGPQPSGDNDCAFSDFSQGDAIDACVATDQVIYLVGDSHAQAISGWLREEAESRGYRLVSFFRAACLPIPRTTAPRFSQAEECSRFQQDVHQFVSSNPAPVIFVSRWRLFLIGGGFDNGEGGVERVTMMPYEVEGEPQSSVIEKTIQTIGGLADEMPVLVLGQIPEAGWDVPWMLAKRIRYQAVDRAPLSTSLETYSRQNDPINQRLATIPEVTFVDPSQLVCDRRSGRCANELDGSPLYLDDDHPSAIYSQMISTQIMDALCLRPDLPEGNCANQSD